MNTIQYITIIQLIFDIALLPRTCQGPNCTLTSRRRRCNCNVEHCGRGPCSRSLRGDLSGIRACDLPVARHRILPLSHHVPHAPSKLECMYVSIYVSMYACVYL